MKTIFKAVTLAGLYFAGFIPVVSAQGYLVDQSFNATDAGYGKGDANNNAIYSAVRQPDGKIVYAGTLTTYNGMPINSICRVDTNGLLDPTFNPGTGIVNPGTWPYIQSIVLQPDGKLIIGGQFGHYDLASRNNLARINTDGTIDATFGNPDLNGSVESVAMQPDGKILLGGNFAQRVLRLNAIGTVDSTFNPGSGADNLVRRLIVQPDGKIIIIGMFNNYNGVPRNGIARLNTDGSLDMTFNPGDGPAALIEYPGIFPGSIYSAALRNDGKIWIVGHFNFYDSIPRNNVALLNADGTLVASVDLSLQPDAGIMQCSLDVTERLLIYGYYNETSNTYSLRRYSATGIIEPAFGHEPTINKAQPIILPMPDGRILFDEWRLLSTGDPEMIFNPKTGVNGGGAAVNTILVLPNDKVLVGGEFDIYNGTLANNVVRIESNGEIDPTFIMADAINGIVNSIVQQPDGKLLVGGQSFVNGGLGAPQIVRLEPDGSIDTGFSFLRQSGQVTHIELQSDGKMLITGWLSFPGAAPGNVMRLNSDGSVDTTFNPGTGPNGITYLSITQPDGKIIIGGSMEAVNNQLSRCLARLNPDGTLDATFPVWAGFQDYSGGDYPAGIWDVELLPDGKMLAAGKFSQYNFEPANNFIRLNPDSSRDTTFAIGNGFNARVTSITRTPLGQFILTGEFTDFNGIAVNGIVRLNEDGSYDPTFDVGVGQGEILTAVYQPDGKLLVGGTFTQLASSGRNRLARIAYCTIAYDTISDTVCGTYTFDGTIYTETGIYLDTVETPEGCINIATLNLTIMEPSFGTQTETACGTYTWSLNGEAYTASGAYTDTIPNTAGCDSIVTLNLTILDPSFATQTETACTTYTWPLNGEIYTASGTYTDTIPNAAGCDSIVTLDLTVIDDLDLEVGTFSLPSDANNCVGEVAISTTGNADFMHSIDGGTAIASSGYVVAGALCPGIHNVLTTDNCGDTLTTTFVIPVDSNYIFNNPFIDSIAVDSLGSTVENCDIYYNGIDTAYIADIFANADTVTVTWTIVDANGINTEVSTYILGNGSGVYDLQLSVFCPQKTLGQYFTVTQAIYFDGENAHIAGLHEEQLISANLYPNPATDLVTITFTDPTATVTVYDAQGKLIGTQTIVSGGQVSLTGTQSGVYFFELITENGRTVKRVVKQ